MRLAPGSMVLTSLTLFLLAMVFSAPVLGGESAGRKAVNKSADNRFLAFGDGTILDQKTGLMWMEKDYWQRENKWVNWYTASEYAQRMNNKKFAGYADWRLPSPEEAQSLYDRRKRNVDKDGDKIYIDRMFPKGPGWSTWTSKDKHGKAIVVSFKDEGGRQFQDKISGVDAFLRLVRGPAS